MLIRFFTSDLEGIQTPNPQSRNLMRYSVAPRGHFFCIQYSVFSIQYSVFSIQYSKLNVMKQAQNTYDNFFLTMVEINLPSA